MPRPSPQGSTTQPGTSPRPTQLSDPGRSTSITRSRTARTPPTGSSRSSSQRSSRTVPSKHILENTPSTLPARTGGSTTFREPEVQTFSNPSVRQRRNGPVHRHEQGHPRLHPAQSDLRRYGADPVHGERRHEHRPRRLDLDVAPLVTSPPARPCCAPDPSPPTIPSLVTSRNVVDVSAAPSYTFSNLIVPTAMERPHSTDPTTGSRQYHPPFPTFFGLVQAHLHGHRRRRAFGERVHHD